MVMHFSLVCFNNYIIDYEIRLNNISVSLCVIGTDG